MKVTLVRRVFRLELGRFFNRKRDAMKIQNVTKFAWKREKKVRRRGERGRKKNGEKRTAAKPVDSISGELTRSTEQ